MIKFTASADYGKSGQFVARITGRDSKFTFSREFVGRREGKRGETTVYETDETGIFEECSATKRGKDSEFWFAMMDGERHIALKVDKADAMKAAKELDNGRAFDSIVRVLPRDVEAKQLKKQRETLVRLAGSYWSPDDLDKVIEAPAADEFPCGLTGSITRRELQDTRRAALEQVDARLAELEAAGKFPHDRWEFVSPAEEKKAVAGQTLETAIESCWSILQALPEKEAKKVLAALKLKVSFKVEASAEQPVE